MMICKKEQQIERISVNGQPIEKVKTYTYLGTNVNENWDHSLEIKSRIEKAGSSFQKMAKLFKCHDLLVPIKIRLL
ncbi:unnamed protein product [Diabrotica balteata]|uniref:Uncharacterized protein n=1 Tax=Diabrotica balteata TaxID=107213 RepID=A0A9N9X810_DIABA|nr:unnamed protein product [Diabrotica balteata]